MHFVVFALLALLMSFPFPVVAATLLWGAAEARKTLADAHTVSAQSNERYLASELIACVRRKKYLNRSCCEGWKWYIIHSHSWCKPCLIPDYTRAVPGLRKIHWYIAFAGIMLWYKSPFAESLLHRHLPLGAHSRSFLREAILWVRPFPALPMPLLSKPCTDNMLLEN